jgi:Zn ribbon nucleic-acid-binding protein
MMPSIQGPACPRCHSQLSDVIQYSTRWGLPSVVRRCVHCGYTFSALVPTPEDTIRPDPPRPAAPPFVLYPMIHCPECNSVQTRVTSTRKPVRHHKCDNCGHCFKSHENLN